MSNIELYNTYTGESSDAEPGELTETEYLVAAKLVKRAGRPAIGPETKIALTPDQVAWLDAQGRPRAETIRTLIDERMSAMTGTITTMTAEQTARYDSGDDQVTDALRKEIFAGLVEGDEVRHPDGFTAYVKD